MFTRNARLFLALTAATPLLFASCKDNNLVTPGNVAGTYQLTLFRGQAPPVTDTYLASDGFPEFPNGGTATWTDGTLTLNADGTFTEFNSVTVAPTGEASHQSAFTSVGTYTLSGGTIVFSAPAQNGSNPRNFTGTVTVNSITYQESNGARLDSFKYQR